MNLIGFAELVNSVLRCLYRKQINSFLDTSTACRLRESFSVGAWQEGIPIAPPALSIRAGKLIGILLAQGKISLGSWVLPKCKGHLRETKFGIEHPEKGAIIITPDSVRGIQRFPEIRANFLLASGDNLPWRETDKRFFTCCRVALHSRQQPRNSIFGDVLFLFL
jgi:hypothetical protein